MREITVLSLLAAQVASTTQTGADVDLGNYANVGGREIKAILTAHSAGADTDESLTVTVEESATTVSSDFAAISGAAFTAHLQETADAVQELHFVATKRYIRAVATIAGTTPSFNFSCNALVYERHGA